MFGEGLGFCAPPIVMRDPPVLRFQDPGGPHGLALIKDVKWQRPELRVRFLDGEPRHVLRVIAIMLGPEGWNAACGVQVRLADDDEEAEIRVTFARPGNWSYLGTEALTVPSDEPTMCLSSVPTSSRYSQQRRVVLHELGHAYGYPHEHSTPMAEVPWDETAVIAYYQRNFGWTQPVIEANVLKRWASDTVVQHEYDRDSIMHYLIPSELLRDRSWRGGGATVLSPLDRQRAAEWYGPPPEYWSEAQG